MVPALSRTHRHILKRFLCLSLALSINRRLRFYCRHRTNGRKLGHVENPFQSRFLWHSVHQGSIVGYLFEWARWEGAALRVLGPIVLDTRHANLFRVEEMERLKCSGCLTIPSSLQIPRQHHCCHREGALREGIEHISAGSKSSPGVLWRQSAWSLHSRRGLSIRSTSDLRHLGRRVRQSMLVRLSTSRWAVPDPLEEERDTHTHTSFDTTRTIKHLWAVVAIARRRAMMMGPMLQSNNSKMA